MDFNFLFTTISQIFITFYVCLYINVSGWLKLAILNIVAAIIVFASLLIFIYMQQTSTLNR